MSVGKASVKLATNQELTGTLTITSANGAQLISEESIATLELVYTTGAAETGTTCQFQIEHSYDNSTWVVESVSSLSGTTDTLAPMIHTIAGGAGSTAYTAQYVIPLCSRYIRVKVKETGSPSNAGNVSIVLTTASGSGQSRNLQLQSSSGTSDVNITQVGGVTVSTLPVGGNVANDAVDSGNPVKVGGQARTTNPTAVADGDRVNAIFDKVGKMVVVPAIREMIVKSNGVVTLTNTTETLLIAAGAAGVFHDLVEIKLNNTSATAVRIDLRDATGGTVVDTFYLPAGDVRGIVRSVPWTQTTAANNWTVQASGSVTDVRITALAIKNT